MNSKKLTIVTSLLLGTFLALPVWGADTRMPERSGATDPYEYKIEPDPHRTSRMGEVIDKTSTALNVNANQVSALIDRSVTNIQGEDLGTVKDLVVSHDGNIFLVVSPDRGDKLVPVPWQTVSFSEDKVLLNVSKDRLAAAPSFSHDSWPDFTAPKWEEGVFGYYGID